MTTSPNFLSNFVLVSSENVVGWHVNMKERRETLNCGEHITKIPKDLFFSKDGITCDVFGFIGDDFLVDYWDLQGKKQIFETYNDLPDSYKEHLTRLQKVTLRRNVIVLCLHEDIIMNLLRSDDVFKAESTIDNSWLPSLSIKNFILDDPFMDYVETHREEVKELIDETSPKNKRRRCESNTMNDIIDISCHKIIHELIIKYPSNFYDANNNAHRTLHLIKNLKPIIYRARLEDENRKVYSKVDLLVRYDYLTKIAQEIQPPRCSRMNTYVPVILTFKKVTLKNDKLHCCKFPKFILTEGLLALASEALGKIQGFKAGTGGYVLGRDGIMGRIDPPPQVIDKVDKALEWRRLVIDGKGLQLLPKPNHPNLYPNMKNDTSDKLKIKYAEMIGELTQLSFVTCRNREQCISVYNVDSINHPDIGKVNPKEIGVKGKYAQDYLSNIFAAQTITKIVLKEKPIEEGLFDAYIDFETFYDFEKRKTQPYMLGVWSSRNRYTCVILDGNTSEDIEIFWKDVKKTLRRYDRVAAWGVVEKYLLDTSPINLDIDIVNLCELSSRYGLQIPGMKSYKLKEIGRCLKSLNLTDMEWNELGSGVDAMTHAMSHYVGGKSWNVEAVMKYNETDCKMLQVITKILYLR